MTKARRNLKGRYYLFVTSLALMAGAWLGHWSGSAGREAEFLQACSTARFAVVYDQSTEEVRHFHCFEIDPGGSEKPEVPVVPSEVLVL
jgi:hypothetical protein